MKNKIKKLLINNNAKIIAHYYTPKEIQILAEETGGFVGDSLEMAKFGEKSDADTLIVSGVKFMGETAKIISPHKTILMPTLEATCSLDIGCPVDDFKSFCDKHPDRVIVVYANTSADVKAIADWVVTSSIAIDVIEFLHSQGKKIIWGPDKHLGKYIMNKTGADMLLWNASCIVHDEFKAKELLQIKKVYPNAAVLVHPESPIEVSEIADFVGSTTQIMNKVDELQKEEYIIATDEGIFHKILQKNPDKTLIKAPTAGVSVECKSCGRCPWMRMNNLELIYHSLLNKENEIKINKETIKKARNSINNMLNFSK